MFSWDVLEVFWVYISIYFFSLEECVCLLSVQHLWIIITRLACLCVSWLAWSRDVLFNLLFLEKSSTFCICSPAPSVHTAAYVVRCNYCMRNHFPPQLTSLVSPQAAAGMLQVADDVWTLPFSTLNNLLLICTEVVQVLMAAFSYSSGFWLYVWMKYFHSYCLDCHAHIHSFLIMCYNNTGYCLIFIVLSLGQNISAFEEIMTFPSASFGPYVWC